MKKQISFLATALLTLAPQAFASKAKLPTEFAGLRLQQSMSASSGYLFGKDFEILMGTTIYSKTGETRQIAAENAEGVTLAINKMRESGQFCAGVPERDYPKDKITSFACFKLKPGKEDVIVGYYLRHLTKLAMTPLQIATGPSLYLMRLFFNPTQSNVGLGLIGKLGSDYNFNGNEKCSAKIIEELKVEPSAQDDCFSASWFDGKTMAFATGHGTSLANGRIFDLSLWDDVAYLKVRRLEQTASTDTAKTLGF